MNPVVAALLDRSGDPASVAWVHDGVGELAALPDPDAALAAAVEVGNTAALQAVAAPKALKKAAAAALHKLRSRGVKVEAAVAPRAFSLGKEQEDIHVFSVPENRVGRFWACWAYENRNGNWERGTKASRPRGEADRACARGADQNSNVLESS